MQNSASMAARLPALAHLPWHHRRLVDHLARLRRGSLTVRFGTSAPVVLRGVEAGPAAAINIRRPAALLRRLFWRGDLGFAESYVARDWSSDDVAGLLELLALNLDAYDGQKQRHGLSQLMVGLRHRLRRNSRSGSRKNIAAHYDLGNDFYTQWLDDSMSYSSAVFDSDESLFDAQQRKYQRMLDLIDPLPGQRILEIGCGWGGFAEYAARRGFRVTGITLSREQLAYARARIEKAGLGDRVELKLCDYRDLQDRFDHIVSIEMFEAVGQEYWSGYFETLDRCLQPGGRVALQVITIEEDQFEAYATMPGGFIQTYIFPGGMLPTRTHLHRLGATEGLRVGSMRSYGIDYADTLAEWHSRFRGCAAWLEEKGYDDRFRRMWGYYLAFCEAGFRARRIDVVQCVYDKP